MCQGMEVRFGRKVGQIGPKWDKSGDCFRWDSVHFAKYTESYLRKSTLGPNLVTLIQGRQPIGCVTFRLLCYSDLPLISTVWFVAGENVPFANRKQDFATVVIRLLSTVSVSRWRWLDKGFCLVVFIVNVYLLSSITALFCIFSFRCIFQRIIMFSGVNLLTRKKKSRLQNIYLTLSFPLVNSHQLIYQIGRIFI